MMMGPDARKGDWMQTFLGIQFWPMDPRVDEIQIEDIAHALSNQCRFAGHCSTFYSVAQHSVMVARAVAPEFRAAGLLHDAAEAYLVDLPRPVKRHSTIGAAYTEAEDWLLALIFERFGLPVGIPEEVKVADEILLATEKRDLMSHPPAAWGWLPDPLPDVIVPWTPDFAKISFLKAAALLSQDPGANTGK